MSAVLTVFAGALDALASLPDPHPARAPAPTAAAPIAPMPRSTARRLAAGAGAGRPAVSSGTGSSRSAISVSLRHGDSGTCQADTPGSSVRTLRYLGVSHRKPWIDSHGSINSADNSHYGPTRDMRLIVRVAPRPGEPGDETSPAGHPDGATRRTGPS